LADEYYIARDMSRYNPKTMKSLLLQLIRQYDQKTQETSARLLHIINGLQLESVYESNHLIYARLQLPGEKLGLRADPELEFQGKKSENGMIDPEHCRILFYLDLAYLKETIIDMHIQKRTVSITILNDRTDLKQQTASLQPLLKQGLEKLDYHLSAVTFKPYRQEHRLPRFSAREKGTVVHQGVDYRI